VRETFGALIAEHQAALARDRTFARCMRSIAADELGHAALSWRVAAWLEPQLAAAERQLVEGARRAALVELWQQITADALPQDARALLGIPAVPLQQALLVRMTGALRLAA